jgi:hypothetical protein
MARGVLAQHAMLAIRAVWSGQALPAGASRVIIASPLASNIPGRERVRHMPSLVRFLVVVGVLCGLVYGGLYIMAVFFEPEPKETSTTVQGVRIPR